LDDTEEVLIVVVEVEEGSEEGSGSDFV